MSIKPVCFNFLVDGDNYSSSIKIADLKKYVTVNVTDSEVKLQCNNNQKLFYSIFALILQIIFIKQSCPNYYLIS